MGRSGRESEQEGSERRGSGTMQTASKDTKVHTQTEGAGAVTAG